MFLLNQSTHRMTIRYDEAIGHAWVPNQLARIPHERGGYIIATNRDGFRSDVEFSPERGDLPRVLFFGDSMTAGDGCYNHERFSERVGELLGVEAYNYGLSGSGTDQHCLIFEKHARNTTADLLVLGVFVENIERIQVGFRPTIDRTSGRELLVPKPYFELGPDDELRLEHVPVPRDRPVWDATSSGPASHSDGVQSGSEHREANPQMRWVYAFADRIRSARGLGSLSRILNPRSVDDYGQLRSLLLRLSRFDPFPAYTDESSTGRRLMAGLIERFIAQARGVPVLIVPIPTRHHLLDRVSPSYQPFFANYDRPADKVHVLDLTSALLSLPLSERRRLSFPVDPHLSPFGHQRVADAIAEIVRSRGILALPAPASGSSETPSGTPSETLASTASRGAPLRSTSRAPHAPAASYILGVSCFYHDSAAALIKDGEIVASAEEERFSRLKNDRRYPSNAINFCLEQANIEASELASIVYYDNAQLTFERLLHTAAEMGGDGERLWLEMLPSWLRYKLDFPGMVRSHLKYEGRILQERHHRSHAASAFYASPFRKAAILTVDGVGEWATATMGMGEGKQIRILKEMHFPHSLGLLYSAFTQFTGFKVNSGEYKMMGLAPYGEPRHVDLILREVVDLKEDGSLELNLEVFDFLSRATMTNDKFAALFGGPAREPESRITTREMDIACSIQRVTEEAMLRMAKTVKRLTGATRLCLAGGVALNCVANGRILREGPFDEIWIQPAAGDAGAALGAALDVHHTLDDKPRVGTGEGRSLQGGTYLGPEFSEDEVEAFLQTEGVPYEKLAPEARAARLAELLAEGKVLGYFAGRAEFGPRALGARSILGDPRDREMQVKLNLKIKYRESFRPFAPSVMAERTTEYFDLEQESPYMLIVAPVLETRRLEFDRGDETDLLEIVKKPRSDVPAVTHVDYSARVQSVHAADNPDYHELIAKFEEKTGCAVLVNTSFNVRGEPIVNTPFDAYRCFMRTEMDALVLGDYLLMKQGQPSWPEAQGRMGQSADERASEAGPMDERLLTDLRRVFAKRFLPAIAELKGAGYRPLVAPCESDESGRSGGSMWRDVSASDDDSSIFFFPAELIERESSVSERARGIVSSWRDAALAECLQPVVAALLEVEAKRQHRSGSQLSEDPQVSDSIYVMF